MQKNNNTSDENTLFKDRVFSCTKCFTTYIDKESNKDSCVYCNCKTFNKSNIFNYRFADNLDDYIGNICVEIIKK